MIKKLYFRSDQKVPSALRLGKIEEKTLTRTWNPGPKS